MEAAVKQRIVKEVLFFLGAVGVCTLIFLFLSFLMGQPFQVSAYIESMIVIVLVCYLIRFVFIVMARLK